MRCGDSVQKPRGWEEPAGRSQSRTELHRPHAQWALGGPWGAEKLLVVQMGMETAPGQTGAWLLRVRVTSMCEDPVTEDSVAAPQC